MQYLAVMVKRSYKDTCNFPLKLPSYEARRRFLSFRSSFFENDTNKCHRENTGSLQVVLSFSRCFIP